MLLWIGLCAGCSEPASVSDTSKKPEDTASKGDRQKVCEAHCTCTGLVCADIEGRPHKGFDGCVAACVAWSEAEVDCARQWCEPAMGGLPKGFRAHACEHAWMAKGLDVCLGYDHDTVTGDSAGTDASTDAGQNDAGVADSATSHGDVVEQTPDALLSDAGSPDAVATGTDTADTDLTDTDATGTATEEVAPDDDAQNDVALADVPDAAGPDATVQDASSPDATPPDVKTPTDTAATDTAATDTAATDTNDANAPPIDTSNPPLPTCQDYCACMKTHCGGQGAYPFKNNSACMQKCAKFSEGERSCFTSWCKAEGSVSSAFVKQHCCEHAWGQFGTYECNVKGWESAVFEECVFAKCMDVAQGCFKVDKCGWVGVCMQSCKWDEQCIQKTCKPAVSAAAWKAFEPVVACAKAKGCVPGG